MSKGRSETHDLARQLFRDQRKVLDLIKWDRPDSAFATAVFRLFGDKPERGKIVRIGKHELMYSSHEKSLVSFLPARWREELDKIKGARSGCENWWAGYPLIVWVEIRAADDGTTAHLKLHAEVGPVSDHKVRKGIIEAIRVAASAKGLERIQFPVGACDKGRLYSRFLRENSIAVSDIRSADEIEKRFAGLIAGFEPEFELVSSIIPKFPNADAP